jgi:hypothetical protein
MINKEDMMCDAFSTYKGSMRNIKMWSKAVREETIHEF